MAKIVITRALDGSVGLSVWMDRWMDILDGQMGD